MQPHEPAIVVLVPSRRDWGIVRDRHWYRLPVKHGPPEIAANWIAFYLPRSFGENQRGVRYYARVRNVEIVRRVDLFPGETDHPRAEEHYYAIAFDPPIRLARPLVPDRGRRLIWSRTTLWRLTAAQTFDDLFSDDPLPPSQRDDVLVGVVPTARDFEIARLERWYRIPVKMVRDWQTPGYVAFYFGRAFGGDAGTITHYARAWHADVIPRIEIFPDQPRHPRALDDYVRIHIDELQKRPAPIDGRKRPRFVLLPTTWQRFEAAHEVNDLVVGDDDEQAFYGHLTDASLRPERAYHIRGTNAYHLADYALFCRRASIQVDIASRTMSRTVLVDAPTAEGTPDGWESIRLSRHDITRRSAESVERVRAVVDASGGPVDE